MSLHHLRTLRRGGQRPASVTVLIGPDAMRHDNGPSTVVIEDPAREDLSPLVGMPVHVLDLHGDTALTLRTIDALEALGVKPLGICGPAGSCGVSAEHERAMASLREFLCAN